MKNVCATDAKHYKVTFIFHDRIYVLKLGVLDEVQILGSLLDYFVIVLPQHYHSFAQYVKVLRQTNSEKPLTRLYKNWTTYESIWKPGILLFYASEPNAYTCYNSHDIIEGVTSLFILLVRLVLSDMIGIKGLSEK
ncbi:CLUMA_CG021062, isoform A [Clunio marinus]|uniref:CLUMA_CG021062, isoform A n=1 Tax=Clunio marinus TaxID=568069 RepID=A0A1J1J7V9_9DIPT|nr:CLUMA_CG021062, isoform A [Clunio marinus]